MTRPRPPSVLWLMALCAWPFGGAVYAHRRLERYRLDVAEYLIGVQHENVLAAMRLRHEHELAAARELGRAFRDSGV